MTELADRLLYEILQGQCYVSAKYKPLLEEIETVLRENKRIMDEAGIAIMDDGEWFFGDPVPPKEEGVE